MTAHGHHLAKTTEIVHIGAIWRIHLNLLPLAHLPESTTQTAN